MKNLLIILFLLVSLVGCEKAFLGEAPSNDPETNFEIFWEDFDRHYGLFVARGFDWDSIYQVYQPQVTAQTTDEELWSIFKEMIAYLDDSHTFIFQPDAQIAFISGEEEVDQAIEELSYDLIKNEYIENPKDFYLESVAEGNNFFYGKIKNKDIGYIYFEGMDIPNAGKTIDDILADIGNHKAIVIDIRGNFGGSDLTAKAIAGRFADGEHLIYTVEERNGPEHNDFDDPIPYYTKPEGEQHFSKPVILLTDIVTISAAEIFTLHMKSFELVTQIGNFTAGDFSDVSMRRFLPNGWQYQYSSMMYLLPDGTSLDGIGHEPEVYIKNTIDDIQAGNDVVIDRAIQYLWDEYGIE